MGRPAAFDRDRVVLQVTDLFWKQGYLGTSISDVVAVTSLKPGSIYNSFDSKQKLLLEALERYAGDSLACVQRCLTAHERLLPGLEQMVAELIERIQADPDGKGCLMLNIWQEMAAHDAEITRYVQQVFDHLEADLVAAFQRAQSNGELQSGADPQLLAKYLMMSTWGLRVMGRSLPDRATLEALGEQALLPIRAALQ